MTESALALPVLISERLVLEPLSFDHSAGMFSIWREPEVCRFSGLAYDFEGRRIDLPAISADDSDKIIDFFLRSRAEGTRCRWALITRTEGEFVGMAGFNSLGVCSEYAFHLHPDAWGRGLMREASRIVIDWLSAQGEAVEVEAFIDPGNRPSVRLAQSLGFRATGQIVDGAVRYRLPLDFRPRQA